MRANPREGPVVDAVNLIVQASSNTWSRAARRKKRDAMDTDVGETPLVRLVCRIRCQEKERCVEMLVDWVAGRDRALFEGFASHVQRKVGAALAEGG